MPIIIILKNNFHDRVLAPSYVTSTHKQKIKKKKKLRERERERDLKHAAQLLNTLHNQLLVTQYFPTFHNAHNCSIYSISPILVNIFNYLPPLVHRWKRYLQLKCFKIYHLLIQKESKEVGECKG
jgi:hypothetical protein